MNERLHKVTPVTRSINSSTAFERAPNGVQMSTKEYLVHVHAAEQRGINQGRKQAAAIADLYREEAGGSESYKSACRHIAEALRNITHDW